MKEEVFSELGTYVRTYKLTGSRAVSALLRFLPCTAHRDQVSVINLDMQG